MNREDIKVGAQFKWNSEPYDTVTITEVKGDIASFECSSDNYKSDIDLNNKTGWEKWKPLDVKVIEAKSDNVVNPTHYLGSKISALDVVNDWNLNFYLGNTIKYIKRYEKKGNPIQDLEKAQQYLQLYIDKLKGEGDK